MIGKGLSEKSSAILAEAMNNLANSMMVLARSLHELSSDEENTSSELNPADDILTGSAQNQHEISDSPFMTGSPLGSIMSAGLQTDIFKSEDSTGSADYPSADNTENSGTFNAIPSITPSTSEYNDDTVLGNALKLFCSSNEITINRIENISRESSIWFVLAEMIGKNFMELQPIIMGLKSTQGKKTNCIVNISKYPKPVQAVCIKFAKTLYDNALLTEYRISNYPFQAIVARIQNDGTIINFVTGHWMEIFVYATVREILNYYRNQCGIDMELYSNISIMLPTNEYFELDILCFVGNTPLWIECKSGEYQSRIVKYKKFASRYNIEPRNSFTVIAGITNEQSDNISGIHKYNVLTLKNFREKIAQAVMDICMSHTSGTESEAVSQTQSEEKYASANKSSEETSVIQNTALSEQKDSSVTSSDSTALSTDDTGNTDGARTSGNRSNRSIYNRMMSVITAIRPASGTGIRKSETVSANEFSEDDYPFVNDEIAELFRSQNIRAIPNTTSFNDSLLDSLAHFPARNYKPAAKIFKAVIKGINKSNHDIHLRTANESALDIGVMVQMCQFMKDKMNVIEDFCYNRNTRIISFTILPNSNFNRFLTENLWIEHEIGYQLTRILSHSMNHDFGISRNLGMHKGNIRVTPDFLIRKGHNCTAISVLKSADEKDKLIEELELTGKWLSIPKERLILVHYNIPDISSGKSGITVLNLADFSSGINSIIALPGANTGNDAPIQIIHPADLAFTPEKLLSAMKDYDISLTGTDECITALDGASSELLKNHKAFSQVLNKLQSAAMNNQKSIVCRVNSFDGVLKSSLNNMCNSFVNAGIFSSHEYHKSTEDPFFSIKIGNAQQLTDFLSGGWIDNLISSRGLKFIVSSLREYTGTAPIDVSCARTIRLKTRNGADIKTSFLVKHAHGWSVIVSCHENEYEKTVNDLLDLCDVLNIDDSQATIVLKEEKSALSNIRDPNRKLTVCTYAEYLQNLQSIFPCDLLICPEAEVSPAKNSTADGEKQTKDVNDIQDSQHTDYQTSSVAQDDGDNSGIKEPNDSAISPSDTPQSMNMNTNSETSGSADKSTSGSADESTSASRTEKSSESEMNDFINNHLMDKDECFALLDDDVFSVINTQRYTKETLQRDRLSLEIMRDYCNDKKYATLFNALMDAASKENTSFVLDMNLDHETRESYLKIMKSLENLQLISKVDASEQEYEAVITIQRPRALRDFITEGWFHNLGGRLIQDRLFRFSNDYQEIFYVFARSTELIYENFRITFDLILRCNMGLMIFDFATVNPENYANELGMYREYIGLDESNVVLVCLNEDEDLHFRLANKYRITVIGFSMLNDFLDYCIDPEIMDAVPEDDLYSADENSFDEEEQVLNKYGYCPGIFDYMKD